MCNRLKRVAYDKLNSNCFGDQISDVFVLA